jgi:hypothetical protein
MLRIVKTDGSALFPVKAGFGGAIKVGIGARF